MRLGPATITDNYPNQAMKVDVERNHNDSKDNS